ncbi:MAG: type II toxin-antitoxin system PemK/MazF family toxin [Deltaproteobacteria bacterium]|nr:type II toxin-antitoxin system PemK/MazF family toxin [Deltaproteobacteria bacterium]
MNPGSPGNVILVKFPFTHLLSAKKRPALLLQCIRHAPHVQLITLAMITSKIEGARLSGDVLIRGWSDAGLLHPSLVRLGKIATVESDLVQKTLGSLVAEDVMAVRAAFRALYQFWLD